MFWTFFWFEMKLRMRSVSTYIFFLIPFAMMFFSVSVADFGPIGTGKVLLNGPYALLNCYGQFTAFGAILIAAIFGPAILRDFQQDTYALIFTKPVKKFDYLGGKWLASFVVTLFVFSGLVLGGIVGTVMPWADKTRLAPVHLMAYLRPFFDITVIEIFFLGALFYCVAALSRRIVVVYLQGVALLAIYLILAISVITTNKLERFWPSVVDPLGLVFMTSLMRYWTVAERNTRLLDWSGAFLWNRLLWMGIGVVALGLTYALFPMSAEALAGKRANKKAKEAAEAEEQEKKTRVRGSDAIACGGARVWGGNDVDAVRVDDAYADEEYFAGDSVLGNRAADGDLLRDQRVLRRGIEWSARLASDVFDVERAARRRLFVFVHRGGAVRRGVDLARAGCAVRSDSRCVAGEGLGGLVEQVRGAGAGATVVADDCDGGRRGDAGSGRVLPLRDSALRGGTVSDLAAAVTDGGAAGVVRTHGGEQ